MMLNFGEKRLLYSLSKAQRRIIKGLRTDGVFTDYTLAGCRQRRTRAKLTNSGVTECYTRGPVVIFSMIRLTELGLRLREAL